jgi:hypothetical protein
MPYSTLGTRVSNCDAGRTCQSLHVLVLNSSDFYWTSPHAHTHSIFVTSCRGERGTKDRPIATRVRQLLPRHDGLSRCRSPQVQRVLIRCSRKRLATLLDTFSPTSPIRAYSYSNPSEHRHMGKKGTYLGNCFRVPCLRPIQQKERGGCRHDRIRFWTKSPARKKSEPNC